VANVNGVNARNLLPVEPGPVADGGRPRMVGKPGGGTARDNVTPDLETQSTSNRGEPHGAANHPTTSDTPGRADPVGVVG
jgi:hypothetical protein